MPVVQMREALNQAMSEEMERDESVFLMGEEVGYYNAAKIRQMSGGQFNVPIVFRGPGGAAHQLGAQHSQALEHIWVNIPGLKVVAPSTPKDAKGLLKSSIRDDNP